MQQPLLRMFVAALRSVARIGSLASGLLLLAFMFGGQESLQLTTSREVFGFCFFPIGVLVGMAVGWRYDFLGGLLPLGSLFAFYIWHFLVADKLASGPYFILFASPGILFLLVGLLHFACMRKEKDWTYNK